MMFTSTVASLPQVKAGRLRALGISSAKRSLAAPDLPTLAESGVPGYESGTWFALLAPAGTPREIVLMLNKETVAIVTSPEGRARLGKIGTEVVGSSPEEFAAFIRSETVKWLKVAHAAGIKPE